MTSPYEIFLTVGADATLPLRQVLGITTIGEHSATTYERTGSSMDKQRQEPTHVADEIREKRKSNQPPPPQQAFPQSGDLHATLAISELEARRGTSRSIRLPGGRHRSVVVPAGAYEGQVISLAGLGEPAFPGGPRGTLTLTMTIIPANETATVLLLRRQKSTSRHFPRFFHSRDQMPNTLPVGTILRNQYLIQELVGVGAFSAVYLVNTVSVVEDARGKRHISTRFALKEVVVPSKGLRHHIDFETISLRGIDHEALPRIYDVFNSNKYNRLYILMDYVEGPNLDKLRTQQPGERFPLSQVLTIMVPILGAVSHLHSQQPPIIHQNIEPDSIIMSKVDNKPVLVDFGVGKQYHLGSQDLPVRPPVVGYEAPEQYSGEISARTDIYGLGATLYTLLSGIVPADALQRKRLIESEAVDPLKPLNQLVPAIPAHVAEAIQRAMSLNSSDRFPTAEQFKQALKSELVRQPPEPVTVGAARQDQQALPPPVLPGGKAETPVPMPVTEPSRARTTRKPAALLLILLALIVSAVVGTDRLFSTAGHLTPGRTIPTTAVLHKTAFSSSSIPTQAPTTPKPSCNSAPPAAASPSYPVVAKLYTGTIYDVPTGLTTDISLTGMQQQQEAICGNFSEMADGNRLGQMPTNGSFEGTITAAEDIQFILTSDSGQVTFSFVGIIQPSGSIAGTYCSLGGVTGKCSDYGLWSVSPAT
jgi:serine/threonine protein kinase